MSDKKFMVICTGIISVLILVIIILYTVIFIRFSAKETVSGGGDEQTNIVHNSKQSEGIKVLTGEEVLEQLRPDIRIEKFYYNAKGSIDRELDFLNLIAKTYNEKAVSDKHLEVSWEKIDKINEKYGFNTETEEAIFNIGRGINYSQEGDTTATDKHISIYRDASIEIVKMDIENFYSLYDIKEFSKEEYYFDRSTSYQDIGITLEDNSFVWYVNEQKSQTHEQLLNDIIALMNQMNITNNEYLNLIYTQNELDQLQLYLDNISSDMILEENLWEINPDAPFPGFKIRYNLGETQVEIYSVGWSVSFSVVSMGYDESNYVKNYEALKEYCLSGDEIKAGLEERKYFVNDQIVSINNGNINQLFEMPREFEEQQFGQGESQYLYGAEGVMFEEVPIWIGRDIDKEVSAVVVYGNSKVYEVELNRDNLEEIKGKLGEPLYIEKDMEFEGQVIIGYERDGYTITFGTDEQGILIQVVIKKK